MEATQSLEYPPFELPAAAVSGPVVKLADGMLRELQGMDKDDLVLLQWEQEREFARRIVAAPKGSRRRAEITAEAYDTVTALLAAIRGTGQGALVMGLHPRYERLVLDLLGRQRRQGMEPHFFEIGFGAGLLLQRVWEAGYRGSGIEVSAAMHDNACRRVDSNHRADLSVGDFLAHDFSRVQTPHTLVYWNDVFEHVAPDEILDYLGRIHEILAPGGQLVTITPNWHLRPSDVTTCLRPPRSEAEGLHLKEYTLREVTGLLHEAGFDRVATPLAVGPGGLLLGGSGLASAKRFFEPYLEHLPFRLASLLCRGLALNCTIAVKGNG